MVMATGYVFSALARYLPRDLSVYGLPSVPIHEPQLHTMSDMARRTVGLIRLVQPEGPYRLAGWSFGGVLAYEIAQQLLDQAEDVEFLALMDAFCPDPTSADDDPDQTPEAALRDLCRRELEGRSERSFAAIALGTLKRDTDFDTLFAHGRTLKALPEHFEYLSSQEALTRCRHLNIHTRAMDTYHPRPLGIPVHLFVATERPPAFPVVSSPSLGWERCIPGRLLHVRQVPGGHDSMMRSPHVEVLGRHLTQALSVAAVEAPRAVSLVKS